jgi:hypothetical protein
MRSENKKNDADLQREWITLIPYQQSRKLAYFSSGWDLAECMVRGQYRSRNCRILRHSVIWGSADEAVRNKELAKKSTNLPVYLHVQCSSYGVINTIAVSSFWNFFISQYSIIKVNQMHTTGFAI